MYELNTYMVAAANRHSLLDVVGFVHVAHNAMAPNRYNSIRPSSNLACRMPPMGKGDRTCLVFSSISISCRPIWPDLDDKVLMLIQFLWWLDLCSAHFYG
eukprot:GHRR01013182.1.p2 GENE.GHRR01013182.1~~GHRR01013182.1.p2  ORF type:complete len:100 (+),score=19.86 GHRR01013182.1:448-747(+)